MAYYKIGLFKVSDNKLYASKTFSNATLAGALIDASNDAEFQAFGTVSTSGSGTTYVVRSIENSTSAYLNVLLLSIVASIYSTINSALASFGVIGITLNDSSPTQATEGNVAPLRGTSYRALHTNLRNNSGVEIGTTTTPLVTSQVGTTKSLLRASISIATSGDNTVISAPGSGISIKIVSLYIENTSDTDLTVILKDGASTAINGAGLKLANPANTTSSKRHYEFNSPGGIGQGEIKLSDNLAFIINLSAAKNVSGFVLYRIDA